MHPDSWRYRGCLIFLVYHILPREIISRAVVLVSACIVHAWQLLLVVSLPCGMVGTTTAGCPDRPFPRVYD